MEFNSAEVQNEWNLIQPKFRLNGILLAAAYTPSSCAYSLPPFCSKVLTISRVLLVKPYTPWWLAA